MFVMYYIYGVSVPSLLIESTDSMMISSTPGSNSGSEQPFIRAKHFETLFTAITS